MMERTCYNLMKLICSYPLRPSEIIHNIPLVRKTFSIYLKKNIYRYSSFNSKVHYCSSTPNLKVANNWYTISFIKPDGQKITVKGKGGDSLLDIVNNNNIDLEGYGACEGTLACSTCHLVFDKKDYDKIPNPPADEELDMLDLAFELTDTTSVRCISFAGSGFLGLYLIGAAEYLQEKFSQEMKMMEFAGSSAGAVIACGVCCDVPLKRAKLSFLNAATHARQSFMGPFAVGFNIQDHLRKGLAFLPQDAHLKANGRLHLSVTRASDFKNVIISRWNSREELIQSVLCSCFIPGLSGSKLLSIDGTQYIDGGFSNRQPIPYENTLTISPFIDCAHISPNKDKIQKQKLKRENNIFYRYYRSLMPLPPHEMMTYYYDGYTDAKDFVKQNFGRKIN